MAAKETVQERLERMKREKEAAQKVTDRSDLVGQLTHESDGEPNYSEIAEKLAARKEEVQESIAKRDVVKYTVYVDAPIAKAFDALCLKRGDQKKYCTEALADFIKKKSKELGI